MSQSHDSTRIRLKDLIALKQRAELFLLPFTGKKSLTGIGNTYSPFKSRGLDFQEVRVYQPGDDIRQIDWHITAKYGKPFTKLYTEEKERTLFFVVDLRSNMFFATHGDFKAVIAARLAAFMAFVAEHQKDKIGYILLTDTGFFSSGEGDRTMLTPFLNSLTDFSTLKTRKGDWSSVIRHLTQLLPQGSFVFLFSDFYDWTDKNSILLTPLSEKNTFLFVSIYDQLEAELPKDSLPFSDGENTLIVAAQNDQLRHQFHQQWQQHQFSIQTVAHKYSWGFLPISTESDYLNLLTRFCFGESHES